MSIALKINIDLLAPIHPNTLVKNLKYKHQHQKQQTATKANTKHNKATSKVQARKKEQVLTPKEAQQVLINGCVAGCRLHQKRLYEQYHASMMATCLRYTNNYEEARDVLHEGFMKVYKNLAKFQPNHTLGSWIKRIMINTAIDHYRKNKKYQNNVDLEYAAHTTDHSHVSVVSQLSKAEIMALVQQLTPGYRTVFNLYVMEGYKHHEIASLLGISEGTSKSNLAKARAKLQSMIKQQLPEYANYR